MTSPKPINYGLVLFPGFQALDVFGPLDILNQLSTTHPLDLSILSRTLDPVSTRIGTSSNFAQSLVPTHTFDNAPDFDVILIPGGFGTRDEEEMKPVIEFLKGVVGRVRYVITVCTGSAVLARTGWLDGRRATSNKRSFAWVTSQGPNVNWVRKARWVVDGNIWTSSGISAGIDVTYAFVEQVYGAEIAQHIADCSEYERKKDADDDRFAELWKDEG